MTGLVTTELEESHMEVMFPLFDHLHDGLMIVDSSLHINRINQSAAMLFGYEPSELLGQPLNQLIPDRYRKAHSSHSHSFMQYPATREMQPLSRLVCLTKGGEEVPVSISLNPVVVGGESSVLAIVRDMRDWEKMKKSLSVSRKMEAVATMASGIAHNFNNLTMAISGNIYLANKLATDDSQRRYLEEASELSHHAAGIVGQLLGYARGAYRQNQEFCLNTIINETILACEPDIPGGMELSVALPEEKVICDGDPDQLQQVIHNMIRNAIQATETSAAKRVAVSLGCQKRSECEFSSGCTACNSQAFQVMVEDTGTGIEKEHLDRIFDPFFTTKGKKGTGLGLSISLGTIKSHGGEIHVKSRVGKGTSFFVCLPEFHSG